MKFLILILVLSSPLAFGSLEIKPGLWKVDVTVKDAKGAETNVSKKMQDAMAKLPPAQRKQMEEMMKSQGAGKLPGDLTKVCYTEEMIKNPESMARYEGAKDCSTKVLERSSKKMTTSFTCKDGTKGTASFRAQNRESYAGEVDAVTGKGEAAKMSYKGTFVSSDCGNVKPLTL